MKEPLYRIQSEASEEAMKQMIRNIFRRLAGLPIKRHSKDVEMEYIIIRFGSEFF